MKPAFKLVSMIWSMTLVASVAAGQQKGYVQAGVLATEQPAGTPNHRVLPAISGSTVGVAAAVGFFVTPKVAIEGELVASGPISTPQRFSYDWFEDFTGESRDMFLGANVRWAARRHLEFVGGAALVFATAAERSILRTDLPFPGRPNVPQSEPDRVDTGVQLAFNGGVAVPLPVSRTIAVVPAFSIRFIAGRGGEFEYLGVGSHAYQFGATVRFTFD